MEKESLLKEWIKLKKAATKAKDNLADCDLKIEKLYGTKFEGNSKSFPEKELGFKINVKKNIYYNMDQEKWKNVRVEIDQELRPEKIKFDVDVKGLNWLEDNKPEIYKKASDCIEIKPGKTTIKVEKI